MDRKFKTKDLVITGLMIALGIVIPMVFHLFGGTGPVFLPMHIPVLLGGFLLPPQFAILLGIVTPLLSSVLTGMPVMFPMGIIMAFELGFYSLTASIVFRKFKLSIIPSLIISMIAGRIVAGIVVFILASVFGLKMNAIAFVKGAVITGVPGIIIQIILIPALLYALKIVKKDSAVNI